MNKIGVIPPDSRLLTNDSFYGPDCIATIELQLRRTLVRLEFYSAFRNQNWYPRIVLLSRSYDVNEPFVRHFRVHIRIFRLLHFFSLQIQDLV